MFDRNRSEAIAFHNREAATADQLATTHPNTQARRQFAANAQEHRNLANAARNGEYPEDLKD